MGHADDVSKTHGVDDLGRLAAEGLKGAEGAETPTIPTEEEIKKKADDAAEAWVKTHKSGKKVMAKKEVKKVVNKKADLFVEKVVDKKTVSEELVEIEPDPDASPRGFQFRACGDCYANFYYYGAGKGRKLIGREACAVMCRKLGRCKGVSYSEKNGDGQKGLGCRLTNSICPNYVDKYCGEVQSDKYFHANTLNDGGVTKIHCMHDFKKKKNCDNPVNYWGGSLYYKEEVAGEPLGFAFKSCGDCYSQYYNIPTNLGNPDTLIGLEKCATVCRNDKKCGGFSYSQKNIKGQGGLGCRLFKSSIGCPNTIHRFCAKNAPPKKFVGGIGKPKCNKARYFWWDSANCKNTVNYWGGKIFVKRSMKSAPRGSRFRKTN